MDKTFRVGCNNNGNAGEVITADELFEILILILPEVELIRKAFIKWISLPEAMKVAVESRLENYTASQQQSPTKVKDMNLHKGYAMGLVLLRVFHEWNHIQDTLGAPGIQPGFTALPKRLELDISFMIRCIQQVTENVIRDCDSTRRRMEFAEKLKQFETFPSVAPPIPTKLSISDTILSSGDHRIHSELDPKEVASLIMAQQVKKTLNDFIIGGCGESADDEPMNEEMSDENDDTGSEEESRTDSDYDSSSYDDPHTLVEFFSNGEATPIIPNDDEDEVSSVGHHVP